MTTDRFPTWLGLIAGLLWFALLATDCSFTVWTAAWTAVQIGGAWAITSLAAERFVLPVVLGTWRPVLRLPRVAVGRLAMRPVLS